MGQVIRAETGMSTARQALLKAGMLYNVEAMNVDIAYASGIAAIITKCLSRLEGLREGIAIYMSSLCEGFGEFNTR